MENTIPGVMELLKGVTGDVANNIKRMPAFVIQGNSSKNVYFIEVKFRANGTFTKDDLPSDYPYKNCYFIIVSKKHIKCITYGELMKGKEVAPKTRNYSGGRNSFSKSFLHPQLDKENDYFTKSHLFDYT